MTSSNQILCHLFPVRFSPMVPCNALTFSRFEWPLFLLRDWLVLRNWTEKSLLFKQNADKYFSSVYKLSFKRSFFLAAQSLPSNKVWITNYCGNPLHGSLTDYILFYTCCDLDACSYHSSAGKWLSCISSGSVVPWFSNRLGSTTRRNYKKGVNLS